ncbi:MAG: hypothetical protein IJ640_00335 [Prevotella sp.]|nr:hypothetical protein [Paludibacteraceae bacterium]MBR1525093.1 hypothetical protein [Prevotella sp.]
MKKFLKNFSVVGFLMLILCVVLGVGDMSGAVMSADGAPAAVEKPGAGDTRETVTTIPHGDGGGLETLDIRALRADMIDDPIDQNLVKIRPGLNRMDTILRYFKPVPTNNFEFDFYGIATRELSNNLSAAATIHSDGDVHEVYGTAPLAGGISDIGDGDCFYVPSVAGGGKDTSPLMLYVYEKDLDNKIIKFTIAEDQMAETTSGGVTTYSIPAIAKDTVVYQLSRAVDELAVKTDAASVLPKPTHGYCQFHMAQIAQSTFEKMMDKKFKWDFSEVEEQVLYEYRRKLEGAILFNKGAKIWNRKLNKYVYTMGGITRQISKSYELDLSDMTKGNEALVSLEKYVFTGNSGSETRILLGGSEFVEAISKIKAVQKQQEAGNTEVVFGMTWNKIISNFGTLLLAHAEIFDEYGWSDKGLVLDPIFLRKWQLQSFKAQPYDGEKLMIMKGEMKVFSEVFGVAVYNPDVHCKVTLKLT